MKSSARHMPAFRLSVMPAAVAASLAAVLLTTPLAHAQLSTATIEGQVASGAAPSAGVAVTATNELNGYKYETTTRADGSYVLAGVAPGTYRIRVGEQQAEPVTVSVGQTSQVNLQLQAGVQQVVITGSASRRDVTGSEVGTSVSRQQIEKLPQVTRNFLSFADLARRFRATSAWKPLPACAASRT